MAKTGRAIWGKGERDCYRAFMKPFELNLRDGREGRLTEELCGGLSRAHVWRVSHQLDLPKARRRQLGRCTLQLSSAVGRERSVHANVCEPEEDLHLSALETTHRNVLLRLRVTDEVHRLRRVRRRAIGCGCHVRRNRGEVMKMSLYFPRNLQSLFIVLFY